MQGDFGRAGADGRKMVSLLIRHSDICPESPFDMPMDGHVTPPPGADGSPSPDAGAAAKRHTDPVTGGTDAAHPPFRLLRPERPFSPVVFTSPHSGSDYSADLLRGAVVDIAEDGSYLDFLFTAG